MKINYSIVIPIYNTNVEYLKFNFDILCNIARDDLEIIIVDDGSENYINELCKTYVQKNKRFKYCRIENSGVSFARNYGISKSSGEHIIFLDADDYLKVDIINKLDEKNLSDIIIYDHLKVFKSKNEKIILGLPYKEYRDAETKKIMNILASTDLLNTIHSKVYKKEIILKNNIQFPVGMKCGEDLIFNIEYFLNCKNILYIDEILTFYRNYDTSSVRNYPISRFDDLKKEYLARVDLLKKIIIDYDNKVESNLVTYMQFLLFSNVLNSIITGNKCNDVLKKVDDCNFDDLIFHKGSNKINWIKMSILKNKNVLIIKILCLLKKIKTIIK